MASPYVSFPIAYIGRRQLKYTVTLGNGWQDDPDVVPSPTDPGSSIAVLAFGPPDPSIGLISWTDATKTAIQLNPAAMTATVKAAGLATVTWQWDPTQDSPQPFTLVFDGNPPPPWAGSSSDSTKIDPAIVEFLGTGSDTFTIWTHNINGQSVKAIGSLAITQ